MTIAVSSRYTTAVDSATGVVIAVRKTQKTVEYKTYVTRYGDSFESLASTEYGDPQQWWRIADVNPQVKFPDFIDEGTVIRIPTT